MSAPAPSDAGPSDLRKAVALVFRRRGGRLTATDFKHAASIDLRWFPPKDAQRLLEVAIAARLVTESSGDLDPAFDVNSVEVPLDFRPDASVFDAPPAEVPLVERLATAAGLSVDALQAAAVAERDRSGSLLTEATALLVAARRRGVDVRPYL